MSLLALAAAMTLAAQAGAPSQCFDLARAESIKPLSSPIPFSAASRPDTIASGPNPQGGGWGAARAVLAMPIGEVLRLLMDQTTLKDPKDAELAVRHESHPGLAEFESVDITIHPFPLISLHWTENWAYRVITGTPDAPREALIAYQKISGTDHIRHFCGNIWLKSEGAGKTDFAVYEETDATRRSAEAIAQGHLGTLRTLRAKATAVPGA